MMWVHQEIKGNAVKLLLYLLFLQVVANISSELHGLKVRNLSIGGVPGEQGEAQQGFRGCLQVSSVRPWP